jgi:hypothetical protein
MELADRPPLAWSAGECLLELEFGPDGEGRFFVARDELLGRFERWLEAQGRPIELSADAGRPRGTGARR